MYLYLNSRGEIDCGRLSADSTVSDMINAVLYFCQKHVNCGICTDTCCAGLLVYTDHVFLHNLLHVSKQGLDKQDLAEMPSRVMRFNAISQSWFLPPNEAGRCRFLSHSGRCLIYRIRPLVCRMHVCGRIEPGFKQIKDTIYSAYQSALRSEMTRILHGGRPLEDTDDGLANPVFRTETYDVTIRDILCWSQAMQERSVNSLPAL